MKLSMSKKGKKQSELAIEGPGISAVCIPAVDKAAEEYVKLRDKRCLITPTEVAAKTKLIDIIQTNKEKIGVNGDGEIIYRYDGQVIRLKPGKAKLSVRSEDQEDDEDDTEN